MERREPQIEAGYKNCRNGRLRLLGGRPLLGDRLMGIILPDSVYRKGTKKRGQQPGTVKPDRCSY